MRIAMFISHKWEYSHPDFPSSISIGFIQNGYMDALNHDTCVNHNTETYINLLFSDADGTLTMEGCSVEEFLDGEYKMEREKSDLEFREFDNFVWPEGEQGIEQDGWYEHSEHGPVCVSRIERSYLLFDVDGGEYSYEDTVHYTYTVETGEEKFGAEKASVFYQNLEGDWNDIVR